MAGRAVDQDMIPPYSDVQRCDGTQMDEKFKDAVAVVDQLLQVERDRINSALVKMVKKLSRESQEALQSARAGLLQAIKLEYRWSEEDMMRSTIAGRLLSIEELRDMANTVVQFPSSAEVAPTASQAKKRKAVDISGDVTVSADLAIFAQSHQSIEGWDKIAQAMPLSPELAERRRLMSIVFSRHKSSGTDGSRKKQAR